MPAATAQGPLQQDLLEAYKLFAVHMTQLVSASRCCSRAGEKQGLSTTAESAPARPDTSRMTLRHRRGASAARCCLHTAGAACGG